MVFGNHPEIVCTENTHRPLPMYSTYLVVKYINLIIKEKHIIQCAFRMCYFRQQQMREYILGLHSQLRERMQIDLEQQTRIG